MHVNYLIDEAMDTGKGSNTVVSLLHHYLAKYGLGDRHLVANADNCIGQNKNNIVMQVSVQVLIHNVVFYYTLL